MRNWKPQALATGIGSLPHDDVNLALDLILKTLPQIPHWPQLPRANAREGFVAQYLSGLIASGVVTSGDKGLIMDETQSDWTEKLAGFFELYLETLDNPGQLQSFALPETGATGFYGLIRTLEDRQWRPPYLKGQLSGPLAVGFQINDTQGRPVYYNDQLREILIKSLSLQARWQAMMLGRYSEQAVLFIDDPNLYAYGLSTHITLNKEIILKDLNELIAQVHAAGALAGVHVCAGMDWSLLLASDTDIVSFDAYGYFQGFATYARELRDYLERGGVVAWGIVPTSEAITRETAETLAVRLGEAWRHLSARGIAVNRLMEQALITPSCGAGTLTIELAEKVYELTDMVAIKIKQ